MSKATDNRDFYTIPLPEQYGILVDAYASLSGISKDFIQKDHKKQAGDDLQKKCEIALQDLCGLLGIEPGDIETVASLQEKVKEESEFIIEINASDLPGQIHAALKDMRERNDAKLDNAALVGMDDLSKLQHGFYKAFVTDNETDINQTLCDLTLHYATLGGAQRLAILAQAKTTLYGENADDVTAKFLAAAHMREGAIKNISLELQACLKDTKTNSPLDDMIEYAAELSHGEDHMLEAVIGVITAKIKILDHPMPEPQVGIDLTHWIPKGPLN